MAEPVTTRVGMADGQIILAFNATLDVIKYPLDAAEEVAWKMLELVEQARKDLTKD